MKTSTQTITLTIPLSEVAALLMVSGSTAGFAASFAERSLSDAYARLKTALGVKSPFTVRLTEGVCAVNRLSPQADKVIAEVIQASRYGNPFEGKSLPKGIWYFKYPAHGTGELVERWLKVENIGPYLVGGYEIDAKGVMTWNFKSFDTRKMVDKQINQ